MLVPLLVPATPFCRASKTKVQKHYMHWRQSNSAHICKVLPTEESKKDIKKHTQFRKRMKVHKRASKPFLRNLFMGTKNIINNVTVTDIRV